MSEDGSHFGHSFEYLSLKNNTLIMLLTVKILNLKSAFPWSLKVIILIAMIMFCRNKR